MQGARVIADVGAGLRNQGSQPLEASRASGPHRRTLGPPGARSRSNGFQLATLFRGAEEEGWQVVRFLRPGDEIAVAFRRPRLDGDVCRAGRAASEETPGLKTDAAQAFLRFTAMFHGKPKPRGLQLTRFSSQLGGQRFIFARLRRIRRRGHDPGKQGRQFSARGRRPRQTRGCQRIHGFHVQLALPQRHARRGGREQSHRAFQPSRIETRGDHEVGSKFLHGGAQSAYFRAFCRRDAGAVGLAVGAQPSDLLTVNRRELLVAGANQHPKDRFGLHLAQAAEHRLEKDQVAKGIRPHEEDSAGRGAARAHLDGGPHHVVVVRAGAQVPLLERVRVLEVPLGRGGGFPGSGGGGEHLLVFPHGQRATVPSGKRHPQCRLADVEGEREPAALAKHARRLGHRGALVRLVLDHREGGDHVRGGVGQRQALAVHDFPFHRHPQFHAECFPLRNPAWVGFHEGDPRAAGGGKPPGEGKNLAAQVHHVEAAPG